MIVLIPCVWLRVYCGRFLSKYHPRCTRAEHEAAALYLQARLQAFLFLLELQRLDTVPLDQEYADAIIKIMDAGVLIVGPLGYLPTPRTLPLCDQFVWQRSTDYSVHLWYVGKYIGKSLDCITQSRDFMRT